MSGSALTGAAEVRSPARPTGRPPRPERVGRASPLRVLDPLRIGLIAPPWVPVPPPEYGGTELVIDVLARGLQSAGHDVRLFATGDSGCPVPTEYVHALALGTNGTLIDELSHVQAAYDALADVDVIHDHTVLGPLWAAAGPPPAALIATNHGEFTEELAQLYRRVSSVASVVAISAHQRATASSVPIARVIHHGIDVDRVVVRYHPDDYALFLGRMNATKGVHRAIRVARRAGVRLRIAAKMWEPPELDYFRSVVEPALGPDVEYLGQVGGREKFELLAGARALLNPIRWAEPFGLVMIEALAAGTPVLAFAEGAAPEIVEHGRTGWLCSDEAEMAERLRAVDAIDRRACRRSAVKRFSRERMVSEHVRLYREARRRPTPADVAVSGGRTPVR